MKVIKAGCILIDKKNKKVGLICRKKQNDYSFPKGHLEAGETLEECAIRGTEEEVGRVCEVIKTKKALPVINYINEIGDDCELHVFFAIDNWKSEKKFEQGLMHELVWLGVEEVENKLSFKNLVDFWEKIKPAVKEMIKK